MPREYTCDDKGLFPSFELSNMPAKTRSLVLIVEDKTPKDGYIQLILYNMSPRLTKIQDGKVPSSGDYGFNSEKSKFYLSPCPGGDSLHEYAFEFYALDTKLAHLYDDVSLPKLMDLMKEHTVAKTVYTGYYARLR